VELFIKIPGFSLELKFEFKIEHLAKIFILII